MKEIRPIDPDPKLHERPDFKLLCELQPNLKLAMLLSWMAYRGLHYLTLPLEVLLRSNFGLRYIQPVKLTTLALAFLICLRLSVPLGLFLLLVLGFALWHYVRAWHHFWAERPYQHSYLGGWPWGGGDFGFWVILKHIQIGNYSLPLSNAWMLRCYEPGLCVLVGLLASLLNPVLGYCLLVSAFGLAIKAHIQFTRLRERWLDDMDAMVESMVARDQLKQAIAPNKQQELHRIVHTARVVATHEYHKRSPSRLLSVPKGLRVKCPNCKARLEIPAASSGSSLTCPACHGKLKIPG